MSETQGRVQVFSKRTEFPNFIVCLLAPLLALFVIQPATAQTYTDLYSFNLPGDLSDGALPEAALVRDASGNLYGTTFFGGLGTGCDIYYNGCGVVFKLDPSGTETVLHVFGGAGAIKDGWNPTASLTLDAAGNLYGTTSFGGAHGYGVVFKLDPTGKETILHSFARGTDGANPNAGLVRDAAGNLYGTTQYGGFGCNGQGCGTVFEINSAGKETVLYRFTSGLDGASPLAGVVLDSSGNIYGTTWLGGIYGFGTVFQLDSSGNEKVLHTFASGSDGANPIGTPTLDQAGNIYGTTSAGGASANGPLGAGTVFVVDVLGNENILYTFTGGADGASPYSSLILDASGNFYGTNQLALFELSGSPLTLLHAYDFSAAGTDGSIPMGPLVPDSAGNFYGTTVQGGANGWGAVFKIQF